MSVAAQFKERFQAKGVFNKIGETEAERLNKLYHMTRFGLGSISWRAASLFILVMLVWLSLCAIVLTTHYSRQAISQQYALFLKERKVNTQYSQWLLEKNAWSSYTRVDSQSINFLNMRLPKASEQMYLLLPPGFSKTTVKGKQP